MSATNTAEEPQTQAISSDDRALLFQAIRNTKDSRLREAFTAVCSTYPSAAKLACEILLSRPSGESGLKRQRWEVCNRCDQEYNEDDNSPRDCIYHTGDMEPDEEHQQEEDFSDNSDYRESYPEHFRWECCGRTGTDPGCRRNRHVPEVTGRTEQPALRKKRKEEEAEEGESYNEEEGSEEKEDKEDEADGRAAVRNQRGDWWRQ